jgi:hypothetical protein
MFKLPAAQCSSGNEDIPGTGQILKLAKKKLLFLYVTKIVTPPYISRIPKLRKATISFFRHLCPSDRTE